MLTPRRLAGWTAVVVFLAATAGVLLQPVHPDPYAPRKGLDRLLYPAETNAFWRLPRISASLNDLAMQVGKEGRTSLWAVGNGGAILHSPDGGRCWEAQGPWKPVGAERVCGLRNLWEHMELVPAALAAEQEPKKSTSPTGAPAVSPGPGDYDPDAARWREALSAAGYDTGGPAKDPTLYDKALAAAVAEFQRDSGIAADGGWSVPRPGPCWSS